MALAFEELIIESGDETQSDAVLKSTIRRFKVPGLSPEDALASTDLNGLPPTGAQVGSLHPRNPPGQNLRCAGFRVGERLGAGADCGYVVTALYNPSGVTPVGGSPPDVTSPFYLDASASATTSTIPWPYVLRTIVPVPKIGGGAPLKGYQYEVQEKQLIVPSARYSVTFNRQSWTHADMALVAAQTNVVHKFNNTYWCFEGAEANQIWEARLWTVTYTWFAEPGTPPSSWAPLFDTGSNTWVAANITAIPARLPFQRWEVDYLENVGSPDPGFDYSTLIRPFIRVINTKTYADTGYQSLPGYTAAPPGSVPYTWSPLL